MGIFAKASGLNKLIEHYPATHDPEQASQIGQTVKVGIDNPEIGEITVYRSLFERMKVQGTLTPPE